MVLMRAPMSREYLKSLGKKAIKIGSSGAAVVIIAAGTLSMNPFQKHRPYYTSPQETAAVHAFGDEQANLLSTKKELLQSSLEQLVSSKPGRPEEPKSYLEELPTRNPDGNITHSVRSGESLSSIAREYFDGSTNPFQLAATIAEANGLSSMNIAYGQILDIPKRSDSTSDIRPYTELSFDERLAFFSDRTIASANPYLSDILQISDEMDIDARIVMAIGSEESHFNQDARSITGAVGLWQQQPEYHEVTDDPMLNLRTKINFVKDLYKMFLDYHEGHEEAALISAIAGYNDGPYDVLDDLKEGLWDGITVESIPANRGVSWETRSYTRRVVKKLRDYDVDIDQHLW